MVDQDAADVALAIEALGSLKSAPADQNSVKRPPSSISLPPISSMISRLDDTSNGVASSGKAYSTRGPYGLQPYHLQGSSSSSGTSAASTSGLTYSPATTPSANTSNSTGGSALSSPSSTHFFQDASGASAVTATSSTTVSRAFDRPPYSSVFVRNGERRPGIDTPGDTGSVISSASIDGLAELSSDSPIVISSPIGSPQGDDGFIGRVSQFPIVSGALKVYERGRNSNRVVKYGANLVESSVKTISKPVLNRVVGPNLAGQLDDFACRQLDRFGSRSASGPRLTPKDRTTSANSSDQEQHTPAASTSAVEASYFPSPEAYFLRPHGKGRAVDTESIAEEESVVSPGSDSTTSASLTRRFSATVSPASQQQIVRTASSGRSRWHNLVIEAGVTAGGIGAAVSEESMKSLKYCLHWLHYATAHLDHQIRILREFILSLTSASQRALALDAGDHRVTSGALLTQEDARAADILDGIKRDVIETIRKVVNVVSTYAGAALPEQARRYVRSSILSIPERWTRAIQGQELQQGMDGMALGASSEQQATGSSPVLSATHAAAERTLTFAVDTLDMLRGVLNIFNDSVDRADAWVERLRIVGLQRQQASSNGHAISGPPPEPIYPGLSKGCLPITSGMKRREDDSEIDDDADMLQRRKNSRTSLVRGTAKYMDTIAMQVDA